MTTRDEQNWLTERPIDFGRDRQMLCEQCGHEWRVDLSWIERFEIGEESCPGCGADSMKSDCPRPTVDPSDPALVAATVPSMCWYHTSTHAEWPPISVDPAARLDEQTKLIMGGSARVAEWAERQRSKALHVGTYEAAIHNMLRRLADGDHVGEQFYLYRVRLRPDVKVREDVLVEPVDFAGDVALAEVCPPDVDVTRYVNLQEDPGGLSLALGRDAIASTQGIAIPTLPAISDERVIKIAADVLNATTLPRVSPGMQRFTQRSTITPQQHRARQIALELGSSVPLSVREPFESVVTFSFVDEDITGWARYALGLQDLILEPKGVLELLDAATENGDPASI